MSEITVNENAYTLLVSMGQAAKDAASTLDKAKAKAEGAYVIAVKAAVMCATLPVFLATIDSVIDGVQRNIGGLAVKFGAVKREKASKDGLKYKVPQSLSNARSTIKFAFEHGVELLDVEGDADADGNLPPRSFKSIMDENTAVRTAAKLEAQKNETNPLKRARYDALANAAKLVEWVKSDSRTRKELEALNAAIVAIVTPAPKADKPKAAAKSAAAGEQLAQAA